MNNVTIGSGKPGEGRLFLVRHGETEWSRTGQHTGVTDLSLTEAGERRATAVGRVLASAFGDTRIDVVLTSPRQRARRTAELAGFGAEATVDDNVAEWDYGAYEGLTSEQIMEQTGASWNIWTDGVPAGATPGEQPADVHARAEAVIGRLANVLDGGGRAIVFSHSHFLRALTATWLQLPISGGGLFSLDTGSISTLGFEHRRRAVKSWNYVPEQYS
ncbi:MAG TPA: histidine phosphatase family protein [Microbacteriaceae bacterium]|nr:histidine phosphatase family protein [Microbacteriaceae bacterium]